MALDAMICQQDPFIYGCKDFNNYAAAAMGIPDYGFCLADADADADEKPNPQILLDSNPSVGFWDSPPANSSSETVVDGFLSSPAAAAGRRKRRRAKSMKNKEEMENQRMTHIAVERNRRRQMNDYLAILRSLMPPSYAQRGDQASIVGGAINFVKELEQVLQFLEVKKYNSELNTDGSNIFSNFFTFPQYSMRPTITSPMAGDVAAEQVSSVAEVEATMVESHANIKILTKRQPKQLLKMVTGLESISLTILHLNITTVDQSVFYSFSVKVEDECQLSTVNEIATAVHDMVGMIQEEFVSC